MTVNILSPVFYFLAFLFVVAGIIERNTLEGPSKYIPCWVFAAIFFIVGTFLLVILN